MQINVHKKNLKISFSHNNFNIVNCTKLRSFICQKQFFPSIMFSQFNFNTLTTNLKR